MEDKTKDLLWKENIEQRIKDIKMMLFGIVLLLIGCGIMALFGITEDGIEFVISSIFMAVGAIMGIVGFFREKNW